MTKRGFAVRALGEVVLRVLDPKAMRAFYEEEIGLPVLRHFPEEQMTFFRIADGFAGHTTILALFPRDWPSNGAEHAWSGHAAETTTLHHFALTIPLAEYDAALEFLRARGHTVATRTYPWIGWRSLYVRDPEDNVVELVCYDRSVLAA
jgi:catechol 2,3-dioxygenase